MNRRAALLRYAHAGKLGGPVSDWFRNTFCLPCAQMAVAKIEKIEGNSDSLRAVWLKGHARPLYYPAGIPEHCLYQVAITTYHRPGEALRIREFLSHINNDYQFRTKGVEPEHGDPVMLHAW